MLEAFLLTPLLLAAEPVRLDLGEPRYSHQTQQNVWNSGEFQTAAQKTFNATQTFDTKGKPKDRDSD
ncbi:hypothetical protein HL658_03440 [Azospirillum sp. RWY-5-1]|uniref:Uncharacterized protein n=1 Tax=Azospirillum oleiclasticum TaxID=2735135 RepID=A0ABX2T3N1_9PROT|nr:hypothetical protein [Azospirillum oleiclasticum]NYZ11590.1 hypothetical protein [Azospirillum oleiclasticum]NYZ18751.1 hypothetical protein [Azospirillum oleiclasticum]